MRLLEGRRGYELPRVDGPGAADFKDAEDSAARGYLERAQELYRKAMRAEPRNPTIRISFALLSASMGRWKEAIAACREVLAADPEDVVAAAACSTLAEALRAEGRPREAAEFLREFLEKHPSKTAQAVGYYELATSLAESGEDLDLALDYAGRALAAAPEELKPYPLAALGWVHYKRQEYDRAIECLRRSSENAPAPTTFHHLGMAYLAAGRAEDAKIAFTKAKTAAGGAGIEDRMKQQLRSNLRLVEKVWPRRKEAVPPGKEVGSLAPAILSSPMRWTRYFLQTVREVPGDAEAISHILLSRAGMIRRVAGGIYALTPLGLRSHRKTEAIVREEIDRAGSLEVELPILQPRELWEESGRWARYEQEELLFHLKDRKQGEYCLAPTSEEAVTTMVRSGVTSYRQLPVTLYQIRTKFRDEIRPRFGLMRGREFLMYDGYSFDVDEDGLDRSYKAQDAAYRRVFAGAASTSPSSTRTRARSAAVLRRSSWFWPRRGRTPSCAAPPAATGPTSRRRRRPSAHSPGRTKRKPRWSKCRLRARAASPTSSRSWASRPRA